MGLYRKKALVNAEQYGGPAFETLQANLPLVAPAGVSFVPELREGRQGWAPQLETLDGRHFLRELDWVVTNPSGARYNVSNEEFTTTYEEVNARPTGPGTPEAGGHTFGWAIKQMQNGALVQREGWNRKGMHLYLEDMLSCIVMFTAQGKHQPGWHPSTPDVLAADWRIAPDIPAAVVKAHDAHDGCRNPAHGTPALGDGFHYAADGQPRHRLDECRPGVCWTDEPANGAASGGKS